jgi:membrane protease YdiL (CAAX protease family)
MAALVIVFLAPVLSENWADSPRWRSAFEVEQAGSNLAIELVSAATHLLVGVGLLRPSRRDDELRVWTWRRVPKERAMLAFAAIGGACTVSVAQTFGPTAVFPVSRGGGWGLIDVAVHVLFLAGAIVFAPIAEVLTYRGFLFVGLRRLVGAWIAMACVTAAYVAGHRRTEGLAVLIGMGLWLMWCAQAGGVLAAIVAHASSNVIALALFYREYLPGPVA